MAIQRGRRGELVARAEAGLVRDGHGDLRAEHVVLERGIGVVDCVEFDPGLREQDVGLDLAFLVMDLARRDERLARALVTSYREAGGDPGDDALVRFFAAQRALIRAKVALIRASQVEAADAVRRRGDAAELLDVADRLGWSVRLGDLAVVCGVAASGKSTLAAALAERAGATVMSSDVVRKRLLGIDATARAPARAYEDDVNRRTYEALGRLAWRLGKAGDRVLVDATFRFAADRRAFAAARGPAQPGVWIECRAPASDAGRPRRRAGDRSAAGSPTPTQALSAARSRSGSRLTRFRPTDASSWRRTAPPPTLWLPSPRSSMNVCSAPDRKHDDDEQRNAPGAPRPVVIQGEPAQVPTVRAANDSRLHLARVKQMTLMRRFQR